MAGGLGRPVVQTRLPHETHEPALLYSDGTPLSNAYIRRLLPLLARRAGILKRVNAHGLRHTHAAELRSEGVDIGIISKQLGHRSITTTARYLDHIAPWAVVEVVRGRSWVGVASSMWRFARIEVAPVPRHPEQAPI